MRAIIAHDGGQTVLGYLDLIDVEAIAADPKPILGYSDISLLHLVLHARTGLVGFHADLATPGLGRAWQTVPASRRVELEKLYSTLVTGTEGSDTPARICRCRSASASPSMRSSGRCRCSNRRYGRTRQPDR